MSNYPTEHLGITKLIGRSFLNYGKTFKAALIFIVLAALVQDNYLFFFETKLASWSFGLLLSVASVVAIYFWSAAIIAADGGIKSTPYSIGFCLKRALTKLVKVVIVAGFYILLFVASTYWMHFISGVVKQSKDLESVQGLIVLLLVGLPLFLLFLLFLFSVPNILTSDKGLFKSMVESVRLVWEERFKVAIALYIGLMVLLYLIIPTTKHAAWLIRHHVKLPFDLLVLIFLVPLVINFMLFALNNPIPIKTKSVSKSEEDI